MNNPTPTRQAFHTVCEACRRHGYHLAVMNGRAWLIKGLKWRYLRTNEVAEYISTLDGRNTPSVAGNVPNAPVEQSNTDSHVDETTL